MNDIENITCSAIDALLKAEQWAFVIGVANGRGMTAGLFEAYAGAAKEMATTPEQRESIVTSYQKIRGMMSSLLSIDAASLLNGILNTCNRPEFRDKLII